MAPSPENPQSWQEIRCPREREREREIYPLIYTPLPYSTWLQSKVRAKGTTWCIYVAEGTKLDQNGLKMGSKHLFVHPEWSKITFGKMCF